ncbi:MAG: DNA-processing protein DprA [Microscillaceae bacterium]|jgi:DNA processing protein|nr:DNA-processing protein DprA [Microscillaceae bacterium]
MSEFSLYEIALTLIDNVGSVTAKQLISYSGSAEAVFKLTEGKLLKIPQVGIYTGKAIVQQGTEALKQAEKIIEQAIKNEVKILNYYDAQYPSRLKSLYDSPLILYYKGVANLNHPKMIGIVGTREATDYGKTITEQIVEGLRSHNPLIISGLAYGIDVMAHRASLKHQLGTIGVMASGLDIIYPLTHQKIAWQMAEENGGLLSENPFGTKPDAMRFPARNRIIAGLADALIVVEAKSKGGALITAEFANNYHKDVFAVPGNLTQKSSEGCNWLIRNHQANLFTSVIDLEYYLKWDASKPSASPQMQLNFAELGLSTSEKQIWEALKNAPANTMTLDEIGTRLQMSVAQINADLLNLELLGLIKALPGKKFGLV